MKGVVLSGICELVHSKLHNGSAVWKKALESTGFGPHRIFLFSQDVPDGQAKELLNATLKESGLKLPDFCTAFGDFWCNVFAQKHYKTEFEEASNARAFLERVNQIHEKVCKRIPGAKPPKFDISSRGDKVLVMKYNSPRELSPLVTGLIHGVAKYYREQVSVIKTGDVFEITFWR